LSSFFSTGTWKHESIEAKEQAHLAADGQHFLLHFWQHFQGDARAANMPHNSSSTPLPSNILK
jgi:hypothetical protein